MASFSFRKVQQDDIRSVSVVVHGNGINFSLDNPKACKDSGLSCPLMPNTTYTYVQTLPVKIYYPPVSHHNTKILFLFTFLIFKKSVNAFFLFQKWDVSVKWALIDDVSMKTIVCVLIPATITYW